MLNQPMSSPIMTTILGFFSCACSGLPAPMSAAVAASSDNPLWIKFRFIVFCLWCWFIWGIGRSQFRFMEAHGGRDEAAIGERGPDGRQEVGSEQHARALRGAGIGGRGSGNHSATYIDVSGNLRHC